jgi:hypothetical protein
MEDGPLLGCRHFAVSGCLLGLAAVLIVILLVVAATVGLAGLVAFLWSLI